MFTGEMNIKMELFHGLNYFYLPGSNKIICEACVFIYIWSEVRVNRYYMLEEKAVVANLNAISSHFLGGTGESNHNSS
jgi:hypothetical protein